MSFYRDTVRTARKEHKCELCGAIIQKGEKYHDKAGNELGDIGYTKECEKCQPVLEEFCNSEYYERGEGYTEDWIQEWWIDYKCDICKYKYQLCEPDGVCENKCLRKNVTGTCEYNTCDEMTHYCRCENFEVKA
ncbi:hypothetical protein [Acetobacterium tundrae]|uniref:Uncharacterized protein n=1 Tax=Acetobacterium tundrae TaxID=132932 RepID=A0ABR6WPW2_9FIRM|nr:hypothetical protein [Acetobacterium tundrae]MBC3798485.1 hypothetical protein [Acetobacterium tundrae]